MSQTPKNIAPPADPWQELNPQEDACGYLSIYYSDDLASLPVRWVTKPGDNKSDPNLETLTYGLFSTCAPGMRSGVVKRRSEYLFFGTAWKGERVLTGYYHLYWYAKGALGKTDYCLAADDVKFIQKPIPFNRVDRECRTQISKWFRGVRLLTAAECSRVLALLSRIPNSTEQYLNEIDRLERFNLKHTGYRYPSWRRNEKFSWESAGELIGSAQDVPTSKRVPNTSKSGFWTCAACSQTVKNKALLKRCPLCGQVATLRPK